MTDLPPAPHPRRWPWFVLATVVVLIAVGAWLGLGLRSSATDVKAHATVAQDALRAAQTAVSTGDYVKARSSVRAAQAEVEAAQQSAGAMQVRLVSHLPVVGQAVSDLDATISAAGLVAGATGSVVDVYGSVTGKMPGTKPLFSSGSVDLTRLGEIGTELSAIDRQLGDAQNLLNSVQATLPGTSALASARDSALADLAPVRATIGRANAVLPLLPQAFGSTGPVRYLVAILNQGELRASGGAPLSVSVVTFDKGRFTFGGGGPVAQLPWPGDGFLTWTGASGSPWNSPAGLRRARFANANFHPDFRSAGFDIRAAWKAGDFPGVQGVLGIDVTAIANVLRRTGPIADTPFGQLTGDNLGQKLLIDSYREFASDQQARQTANQILVSEMLKRLTSGSSLLSVMRALGESAPGRHVQVFDATPALQDQLSALGLDGSVDLPPKGDAVAFFSQNANGSKVDVFQKRTIEVIADVAADGSATVTQAVTVRNAIPVTVPVSGDRTGYTSAWSRSAFFFYQPVGATDVSLTLPGGFDPDPFDGADWTDDGYGGQITRATGWIAPRQSAMLSLSYRLPAGTFTTRAGGLSYTFVANPQPLWQAVVLHVSVTGPSGRTVTAKYALNARVTESLPVS